MTSLPSSQTLIHCFPLQALFFNTPDFHNSPRKEFIFPIRRLRHTTFILFADGHVICLWSWNQMLTILVPQPALITISVGFFLFVFGVKRTLQLCQKGWYKMFSHCCFNLHVPDFWDIYEDGYLLSSQASSFMNCLFIIFAHFPFGLPVSL